MAKKGNLNKPPEKEREKRPLRIRRYKYIFLIVCEDENTERVYFEQFERQIPRETIFLRTVGTGKDPLGVVNSAIQERTNLSIQFKKEIDEVWAVFDKDDAHENQTKIKRFNDAFDIARNNKIDIAYSNEVFELWLLLHLVNVDGSSPLPRKTIYDLLQKNIRKHVHHTTFVYEHGNTEVLKIIMKIGNAGAAIKRSEILLEKQNEKEPIEANPSTKVHILVQRINEWIAYYSYK